MRDNLLASGSDHVHALSFFVFINTYNVTVSSDISRPYDIQTEKCLQLLTRALARSRSPISVCM